MQNMPVMLNAFDDEMRFIVWNVECERVTGYSATEILDHPKPLELLYPDPVYRKEMIAEIETITGQQVICHHGKASTNAGKPERA